MYTSHADGRLQFEQAVTLHSAVLERGNPVLALALRSPDRLLRYGWLRVPEECFQPFPRGVYLPELVRTPAGALWVCAGMEVEEVEREVLFPLGDTPTGTRSHIPSQTMATLGFQGDTWVRLFDKGYALDPLDAGKKRSLVRLKETPPRSAQLDAQGQVQFLSGFRPLLHQTTPLPDLSGGGGGFQLLSTAPTLDILTGLDHRLVRHRLRDHRLVETQTLLELPDSDQSFYSLWNPQHLGENRFLARFTFDRGNGWALIGPDGLERHRLNLDRNRILHSLDYQGGVLLEVYYNKEDPHSLWLNLT